MTRRQNLSRYDRKLRDIPTRQTNSAWTIVIEKDAKPDIKEVTKSVDFLEMLEKQSAAGNQSDFKNGTADTGSELSQEELYQLIREGISYYDSLLESGSVDFFMQTSSAFPDPGTRDETCQRHMEWIL